MGKRGDKRRKKAKEKRRARAIPYEAFTLGPLTIERYGRYIRSSIDHEHPAYAEFRDAITPTGSEFTAKYEDLRDQFISLTDPYDAFDLLASLWMMNVPRPADTYKEWDDPGLAAACELAATLFVTRTGRAGTTPEAALTPPVLSEAQRLLHDMLQMSAFAMGQAGPEDDPPDEFEHIRMMARMHRLSVRGVSYDWQEEQTTLDLFEKEGIRDDVIEAAGFSASTALALSDKVFDLGIDRLRARGVEARQAVDALIRDLHNARNDRPLVEPRHARIVEALGDWPTKEAERHLQTIGIAWIGAAAGASLSFTADELAEYAGTDLAETQAFVEAFSVRFNEFEDPPDLEILRDRPLLRDDAGQYLCFSQHNLHWGVRPRIENALKNAGGKAFARYERHRRSVVERRAVEALASALKPDWAETGLHYRVIEDGQEKRPEIDGLLRLDSALLIVEAKGSSMRPSARRGAPSSLRSWLENEVSRAAQQVRRTSKAVAAGSTNLYSSSDKPMDLDLEGIRHVIEIVVVLEDLPVIGPSTWRLADAGLVPTDPTPWVVSLHELEIICDLVERPAELIHYLQRRQRMDAHRQAWALDELDYFAHYLLRGLFWHTPDDDRPQPPEQLLSHTEAIDAYYSYTRGERTKKAKIPSQNHHAEVEALLDSLGGLRAPGRLDAALAVLDVDSKSRRRIASGLTTLKRRSSLDGRSHDQTLVFDDWGITVMTVAPSESADFPKLLQNYCTVKKHQFRSDRWIGFGGFAGPPEPAQVAVVLDHPWAPDDQLDAFVTDLPSAKSGNFSAHEYERQQRLRARRESQDPG